MSATTTSDPKEVLARLHWLRAGDAELSPDPVDWRAVTVDLYDALDTTLKRLEAGGLCRGCGKPIGAYCVQCAWPHRRSRERPIGT